MPCVLNWENSGEALLDSVILSGAIDYSIERAETTGGMNRFLNNQISTQDFNLLKLRYSPYKMGALMLSININHPDVEEFITIKQDLTKVTSANISVKLTDDFMKAVVAKEDYLLKYPIDTTLTDKVKLDSLEYNKLYDLGNHVYVKRISANKLWKLLIKCAWNTGEPGIIFEDSMHNAPDGNYDEFKMVSTNPCQPDGATVLTPEGIKHFKDIQVGDAIWSKEGWTKVFSKQCTGVKKVYKYSTNKGEFLGTPNHRVVSGGSKIEIQRTETVDFLLGNKHHITNDYNANLYELAYMDGIINTVGFTNELDPDDCNVYMDVSKNREYLLDYNILVKPDYKVHNKLNRTACIPYKIKSYNYLNKFKRNDTKVAIFYLRSNPMYVCAYLKGVFSVSNISILSNKDVTNNPRIQITGPKDLLQLYVIMLSSLGIMSSIFSMNSVKGDKYALIIHHNSKKLFIDVIGHLNPSLEAEMKELCKTIKCKVTNKPAIINDIKYMGEEPVYSITVTNKSHTYWTGGLNVSNCGEIGMGAYDSCRLIHLNLTSFIKNPFKKDASIDTQLLYKVSYEIARLADDVVDLEIEALNRLQDKLVKDNEKFEYSLWNKMIDTAVKGRRTGIGFTGLADAIAMLNIKYGTNESLEVINTIARLMFLGELDSTRDMGIERGIFPSFNAENEQGEWYKNLENICREEGKECYTERRNISWSAIAPTGTVSIMAGCSSGIEPVFLPFYNRRRKCMSPEDRVDDIDINGEKYSIFLVMHPTFRKWIEASYIVRGGIDNIDTETINKLYKLSPWYEATANDINWENRVRLQGIIQKYITHSISSTINLPKDVTQSTVSTIYLTAWEAGNKGQTVYRDGCREGVLTNATKPTKLTSRQAPKRPKSLEADYYQFKFKGTSFIILVGLFNGTPYEIFALKAPEGIKFDKHKGHIIKERKMKYSFHSDKVTLTDLQSANNNKEEDSTTLYASMLLRHGVDIRYIIKTAKKVDSTVSSFTSAMCRVLYYYIPKTVLEGEKCPECGGKLVREAGCIHCMDCSYSKCD